ncbi:hypothetical protein Nepgr_024311 [Nepenthes gracilis]|uniref:DUF4378 domain-containing protein n=1 Tax=Nepenthes gracilis TaxID=150966 RepID=A0AAD3XYP1_NEPGR|nr:hypothetical protein Nepgr_024311 [Nepenthes gracilis]
MEEEMIGEQDQKDQATSMEGKSKHGGHARRNRRQVSRKSFDIGDADLCAAEGLVSQNCTHPKHKSANSFDLSVIMEKLYSQIDQTNIHFSTYNHDIELLTQSNPDFSVIEQNMEEALKVCVSHFTDEKSFTKDGKIQPSKELLDALSILKSNKEVFPKLLQDPDSPLVKHMPKLWDFQVEKDRNSKKFVEEDLGNTKQESFFWRKFKGLERSLLKKNENSQDLDRIVVLKPGLPGSLNMDLPTSSSLLQSPNNSGNNGQIEKASSNFSFTMFRRRLKSAMSKEQLKLTEIDNAVGENGGIPSPSRNHFFIERIPRLSVFTKSGGSFTPERRVSNIYIEAKKHIAEVIGGSDVDANLLSRKVPKSLGRILSFPEYSSPISSPRKDRNHIITMSRTGLSPCNEILAANESACHQGQEINAWPPGVCQDVLNDLNCGNGVGKIFHSAGDDMISDEKNINAVDVEVISSSDTSVHAKGNNLHICSEPCSLLMVGDEKDDDTLQNFEEKEESTSSELKKMGENELSSSPTGFRSDCLCSKRVEDLDGTIDKADQPSPISVLELIFREDDISPPGIKSYPTAKLIPPWEIGFKAPREIGFKEQKSSLSDSVACIGTCVDEKKLIFDFVKAVVQISGLTWDELFQRFLLSDHILDPSLFNEVEFLQDQLCDDPRLLFDLIDEVLLEICWHNFGCFLLLEKPFVLPVLKGKDVFVELWDVFDWYLQLPGPHTLDKVLAKDNLKSQAWMNLQIDRQNIGIAMEEAILEELMEDTIINCIKL